MAKICPLKGCQKKPGLCVHDKIMIGMGVIVGIIVLTLGLSAVL